MTGVPSTGGSDYLLEDIVEGWALTIPGRDQGEQLTGGLRLSEPCPCARIRKFRDPTLYARFPVPLQTRGTLAELAYYTCHLVPHEKRVLPQLVIPWEFGDSHLDFVIEQQDDVVRIDELKCNGDGSVDPDNIAQVQRQLYVARLAVAEGVELFWTADQKQCIEAYRVAEALARVVVMDPKQPVIHDLAGFTVRLHEARTLELDEEWARQKEVMEGDPRQLREDIHWPAAFPDCTCGKCWREQPVDGNLDVAEQVDLYVHAREAEKDAKVEKELAKDELLTLVPATGQPLIAGGWKVTNSPPGEDVEKFDYKKGYAALGPDATHDELRAGGFAVVAPKSPGGIRVNKYVAPKTVLR